MDRQLLATDFFLIVHDEFSGKLRISTELLGCGIVGAQLADLVIAGRVATDRGHLVVVNPQGDLDDVDRYVLDTVADQDGTHSVQAWVEALQDMLYDLIGRRLETAGVVRRESGHRWRRGADRFPATDLLAAVRPQLQLEHMLRNPQEFDLLGAVLAVLVGVLGIENVLDSDLDRGGLRELFAELHDNLPTDLRAVTDGVRAAASAITLSVRR